MHKFAKKGAADLTIFSKSKPISGKVKKSNLDI